MKNKTILIVAAHPDDEILGCGGTIAKLVKDSNEAYTLILGEGKTSRGEGNSFDKEKEELRKEAIEANCKIGVREVYFEDLPDNSFDSVPLLEVIKKVDNVKEKVNPDIIFTHFRNDLNIDHRVTYDAVLTATRPMEDEKVCDVYSFEVLSSTEWNYPLAFSPNVFFDITNTIEKKVEAMNTYKSELREYPHPRSEEGIRALAEINAIKTGIRGYCEAFELVRSVKR